MTSQDTTLPGGRSQFPSTCWEDLCRAGDRGAPGYRDALNRLAGIYWRPVYRYIRVVWGKSNDDAKDLTQEFFAAIFDPEFVARVNPDRGSFRAFVVASLRNFLANEEKARQTLKRGGGVRFLPLDLGDEEGVRPVAEGETPEDYFDRAWAQSVLERATEVLKQRLKPPVFEAFRTYCLAGDAAPSYRDIAERLDVTSKDVDNYIYAARKEFRNAVAEVVREFVSDPNLVSEELKRLFG